MNSLIKTFIATTYYRDIGEVENVFLINTTSLEKAIQIAENLNSTDLEIDVKELDMTEEIICLH